MSLHRRAARKDGNHEAVVAAFRAAGCSVQPLSSAGCPDLLVGWMGKNFLVEVKDGSLSPSRRRLTPEQAKWHRNWRGQVWIVESAHAVPVLLSRLTVKADERDE